MAKDTQLSNGFASGLLNGSGLAQANGGFVSIYTAPKPANANTAVTTQTLLATGTLSTPAFGVAVNGVSNSNAIGPDSDADATGTGSWFRVYASNNTTVLFDGTVGVSGGGFNLEGATTSIVQHQEVDFGTIVYTQDLSVTGQ